MKPNSSRVFECLLGFAVLTETHAEGASARFRSLSLYPTYQFLKLGQPQGIAPKDFMNQSSNAP